MDIRYRTQRQSRDRDLKRLYLIHWIKGDVMVKKPLFIRAEWDDEAQVWVATSDDVPGLATEENNLEALIVKLKTLIPELLDANGIGQEFEIPFEILTRRFETAYAVGH